MKRVGIGIWILGKVEKGVVTLGNDVHHGFLFDSLVRYLVALSVSITIYFCSFALSYLRGEMLRVYLINCKHFLVTRYSCTRTYVHAASLGKA